MPLNLVAADVFGALWKTCQLKFFLFLIDY